VDLVVVAVATAVAKVSFGAQNKLLIELLVPNSRAPFFQ